MARLLLEGRPGSGKTTAIVRLVELLRGENTPVCGFVTRELASEPFRDAVAGLFDSRLSIVATVMSGSHPFTDALKRRDDTELIRIARATRDELPEQMMYRVVPIA